jgi:hypothetical protein
MPTALGLAVAITALLGYKYLSARMADLEIEMRNVVRDLTTLANCGFRPKRNVRSRTLGTARTWSSLDRSAIPVRSGR